MLVGGGGGGGGCVIIVMNFVFAIARERIKILEDMLNNNKLNQTMYSPPRMQQRWQ